MPTVADLTKSLVGIPSFPKDCSGEERLAFFIEEFLKKNCSFSQFEKQTVGGSRYNLIVSIGDIKEAKLIFFCHMDTVMPSNEQLCRETVVAKEGNGKIFGLGAVDMKGGIAALLIALSEIRPARDIAVVFYCDEEFDFLGMRVILERCNFFGAKLAVFTEPTDLHIANGCRGLIEIDGVVEGFRGHAGRPRNGLNAIILAVKAFELLELKVWQCNHEFLGHSVCNLASIVGGQKGEEVEGKQVIESKGNVIPDIANMKLECRTSVDYLDAKYFCDLFGSIVDLAGGKFTLARKNFDFSSFFTKKDDLSLVEKSISDCGLNVSFGDISQSGYFDAQMFVKKFHVPTVSFGPGPEFMAHKKDEYVSIESLEKTIEVYKRLITAFCF